MTTSNTIALVFIDADGTEHRVTADAGTTMMRAAIDNDIAGIVGDCGGACACATCHAYIDPAFMAACGAPGDEEREMLDGAIDPEANSRLTCQIVLSPDMNGIRVRLPASQS